MSSGAVVMGDLTLVRPLVLAGIEALVVTTDPHDITLSSRHVSEHLVVPGMQGDDERETLSRLIELGRSFSEKPPLFYGSDESLDFVHRHRHALAAHYRFLLNPPLLAATLLDKARFTALAAELGIDVPASIDGHHDLDGLRPPLLVKPKVKLDWKSLQRELFGGEGKARVFDAAEELLALEAFRRYRDQLIVQECIPGDQVLSYHCFADAQSNVLASFCGRKVRSYPLVTGASACIELMVDPALAAFGSEVIHRMRLVGPCKLDIVLDERDGRFVLLEANARYNLWHYLGAVHGINLVKVAYDYLTGAAVENVHHYRPTARWCNLYRDYQAFRALHDKHEMRLSQWLRPLAFEPTIYESFAWDDPLPAARWLGRQLVSKVRRWHATE